MFSSYKILLLLGLLVIGVSITHCNTIDMYRGSTMSNDSDREYHSSMLCMDLRPQKSVDMKEMLGMWYGVEIIVHNKDIRGVFKYHSCVQVHLSDITAQMPQLNGRDQFYNVNYNNAYSRPTTQSSSIGVTDRYYNSPQQQYQEQQQSAPRSPQYFYNNRQQPTGFPNDFDSNNGLRNNNNNGDSYNNSPIPKYLQLIWSENENNLEYILNYTNENPSIWHNVQPQRGSLAIPNQYTQFTGTVQVIKAVSDHVVLTFCNNSVKSSIYTIVLSRNRWGLSEDTIRGIRTMLFNRGLTTDTIRQVCISSATQFKAFQALLLISLGFITIFKTIF